MRVSAQHSCPDLAEINAHVTKHTNFYPFNFNVHLVAHFCPLIVYGYLNRCFANGDDFGRRKQEQRVCCLLYDWGSVEPGCGPVSQS